MSKRKLDDVGSRGEGPLRKMAKTAVDPAVPGLSLLPAFVTKDEAQNLTHFINSLPWATTLSRRVQQYGFEYNYSKRSSKPERTAPIPPELEFVLDRLVERKLFARRPDQVIVNEYQPGQGIAPHVDRIDHFGEVVASLSLGSEYIMDFEHKASGRAVPVRLPVGSLVVLSGPARYEWTHGIAKRKTDGSGPSRTRRETRISVTLRTMVDSSSASGTCTASGAADEVRHASATAAEAEAEFAGAPAGSTGE